MKKLILSVSAIAGLAMAGNAQQVALHDANNADASSSNDISINGVIDTSQDVNLQLLVGTSAGNVTTDVVTLLLSQATSTVTTALGTVQSAAGDISNLGLIADHSGNGYGVAAGTKFYEILAWTGNSSTYAGGAAVGSSGVLAFDAAGGIPTSGLPPAEEDLATPINLTTAVVMPEPSTLAMAGVGLVSMLFFRSRKNK
jgi:hypothetical protein